MRRFSLIIYTLFSLLLSACGEQEKTLPNLHETKYRAVGDSGEILEKLPLSWHCVFDQFTGLTWEVKSDQPGLHDWRNTYSWYDPSEANDELDYRGTADGGTCTGSACDVHAWVAAVNETGLCGFNDWRLASRDELFTLSDMQRANSPPTINTEYFPFAQAAEYWSSNDYSYQWDAAWLWSFKHGHDRVEWKATPNYARLVRGNGQQIERVKD